MFPSLLCVCYGHDRCPLPCYLYSTPTALFYHCLSPPLTPPIHPRNKQDAISDVFYIWALTKDAEKPNPLTKGWKIVEFAIQGVREAI